MIRFEVTDEITVIDGSCPCGSAYTRIEEFQGRLDDSLHYADGLTVHPIVLRSPLGRQRTISEYQVHQTPHGVRVLIRLVGEVDLPALHAEIAGGLAKVGLVDPEVVLIPVESLDRQSSGKLKRFVPLDAPAHQHPQGPRPRLRVPRSNPVWVSSDVSRRGGLPRLVLVREPDLNQLQLTHQALTNSAGLVELAAPDPAALGHPPRP